jgi:hypothetical protein
MASEALRDLPLYEARPIRPPLADRSGRHGLHGGDRLADIEEQALPAAPVKCRPDLGADDTLKPRHAQIGPRLDFTDRHDRRNGDRQTAGKLSQRRHLRLELAAEDRWKYFQNETIVERNDKIGAGRKGHQCAGGQLLLRADRKHGAAPQIGIVPPETEGLAICNVGKDHIVHQRFPLLCPRRRTSPKDPFHPRMHPPERPISPRHRSPQSYNPAIPTPL